MSHEIIPKVDVCIEELDDFKGTLGEMKTIIEKLIAQHGEKNEIFTDAGANNVSFYVRSLW